jgi:hypothetical protein
LSVVREGAKGVSQQIWLSAVWRWVTAKGKQETPKKLEQKAAKVSKKILLRRSEIFIAPASNRRLAP